jgi:PiT family inorganic phosphate transporter
MAIIAEHGTTLVVLAVIFGLLMAWGIGANDVANALGTSVGSGAITVGTAIIIAAIFEFLGAALAGGHVTKTVRKGIIDPSPIVDNPELLVFGMLASLLAAATWLAVASFKGWPVSTTHSIVGALFGFGIAGIGPDAVNWSTISQIVASWVVSPVVGGLLAFGIMMSVQLLIMRPEDSLERAKRWTPAYAFLVGFIMSLVTLFKGLKHLNLDIGLYGSLGVAAAIGLIVAVGGRIAVNRINLDELPESKFQYSGVERIFTPLMIVTACAMAFAHGSNDVANGIGPLTAVLEMVRSGGDVSQTSPVPVWVLLLGGGGIVLGLMTYGYRVMQTIGTKITALTPSSGFCATMAAAATVVLASRTGMPVSTTHIAVGAVMGVGLARGFAALDLRVIGSIFASWIVTLPAGAFLSALFYFTLKGIFT